MKKLNLLLLLGAFGIFSLTSCKDDDDTPTTKNLNLNIQGLQDLGDGYTYENWIMVNGSPVSAGTFNVDAECKLSKTSFSVDATQLDNATAYVLTIEPSPDNSPNPSDVHILGGDFSGSAATVSVGHSAALGNDFTASMGKYILATPTDGNMMDELSGVWFLDPTAGPGAGLSLPTLPAGWEYEGWAVVNGTPVSTGKFTSVSGADNFSGYSGTAAGAPPFPGEDLLMNAPSGLSFPTNLSGGAVVISVEPKPDNSSAPFVLKPLLGQVATDAADHTVYEMDNNASATNPTGTATKQ